MSNITPSAMMNPTPKHPNAARAATETLAATEALAPYRLHGARAAQRSTHRRAGTLWRTLLAVVLGVLMMAAPAQAQTPVVEAENADEATVFQVNEDGGLLGPGAFETGVIPAEGAGTRLMWHPAKAAFRAGTVGFSSASDGSEWDESNIGIHSVALGSDVTASAQAATALGLSTTASGGSATALGNNTEATGFSSTAMGNGTTASRFASTAMGQSTMASGSQSTAMGFRATASGNWSTAMGNLTEASGFRSTAMGSESIASGETATAMGDRTGASGVAATAMGSQTIASGNWSTAMGNFTAASGLRSTAMGFATDASGNRSVAMGHGTTSQAYASLAIGRFNVATGNSAAWVATDPLLVAGNGSSDTPSNALTLFKDGNLTIAGNLTQTSDRRLKTDVAPLGDVLAALEAIQPVRYRFKDDANRPAGAQLGLIAQEVQQAFPELVTRGADGYLSVAYPKLTAVLLRGLQEQQDHIDAQQALNKAQQAEIDALRVKARQVDMLETRLALVEARVQDDGSVLAGWSGWGAAGLLALLVLGGLLIRRRPGALAAMLIVGLMAAAPAQAQTPVVEATNADEEAVLQVNDDGGLLGPGVFGTGAIPAEGRGTRLMWHPAKAAFRAGRVGAFNASDGTEWNDASVGLYSAAMGLSTTASGFASMAIGRSTIASGNFSTAMGLFATAQAFASLVIGRNNVVDGNPGDWSPSDPLFVAGNGGSPDNPSNALTLFKDGDLTIAGDLTQNSDRRLKTDIAPLGPALDRLLALDPVRYRFKDGTNRPAGAQLGLIAQEVQQVFPELVTRGADGYLSVAYPKLTAVLLGGLQEQQTQIDMQQAQIETLEARLARLEALLTTASTGR